MALDFVAGCIGGCAGVIIGHPFDTVKVKLQTQSSRNPVYRGTWDCFTKILKAESVAGVYRGVSSPMAGIAVVNAIVFGVYGNVQRNMSDSDSLQTHFLAGAAAGLFQSVVSSPIELVKSRVQTSKQYHGPWDCFVKTHSQEGIRGIFKGLGVTGAREFLGYGLYFASYEALTRSTSGDAPVGTASMLLAGGLAGTVSWIFTYPLDVIKTRIQVDVGKYSGYADCLKKSVQDEGMICLARGLTPTLLRAFPTNAVTFTVVTWVFRLSELEVDKFDNVKTRVMSLFDTATMEKNVMISNIVDVPLAVNANSDTINSPKEISKNGDCYCEEDLPDLKKSQSVSCNEPCIVEASCDSVNSVSQQLDSTDLTNINLVVNDEYKKVLR